MNYARFSCDVMSLEVRIDNDVAQHVYRNLGFQNGGKRKNYYGEGEDALVMGEFEMTNNTLILAIETSCDETSVSVVKNGTELLSNTVLSQIDSHKRFGGVVPEVASRHHVEGITATIDESLVSAKVKMEDIDAIAVTQGPGLIGALLIGINAAKAFGICL